MNYNNDVSPTNIEDIKIINDRLFISKENDVICLSKDYRGTIIVGCYSLDEVE